VVVQASGQAVVVENCLEMERHRTASAPQGAEAHYYHPNSCYPWPDSAIRPVADSSPGGGVPDQALEEASWVVREPPAFLPSAAENAAPLPLGEQATFSSALLPFGEGRAAHLAWEPN